MLNVLLNHSPPFVIGELMLALSLALFGVALIGAVRDRYSARVPVAGHGTDRLTDGDDTVVLAQLGLEKH